LKNAQIDRQNERILKALKSQRATVDFQKLQAQFTDNSRISQNMRAMPDYPVRARSSIKDTTLLKIAQRGHNDDIRYLSQSMNLGESKTNLRRMAEKQFNTPASYRNDAALGNSSMPTIDRSIKGLRHQRVTTPKGG